MSSLKPIYLALGFVGACSLVNKFDPLNDVPANGGTGGMGGTAGKGGSTTGGEAGMGGTSTTAGSSNGGKGGSSPVGEAGEGGGAGEGNQGTPITNGLIVVGSNVGSGLTAKHSLVLLNPQDGSQIASVPVSLNIFAVAYEAQRNKWFVFTGSTIAAETTGPLLVGTMTTTGFQVEGTSMVAKPTDTQGSMAVLNQRILYRTGKHVGTHPTDDDTLTLLDTSKTSAVVALGKLTIPYRYSISNAVGRPAGSSAGGRVFFLHQNFDTASGNCETADSGSNQVCSIYYSSLSIAATDKALSLPAQINEIAQLDQNGSQASIAIQPGSASNTVAIAVPPREGTGPTADVYKFNAATGSALGAPVQFSLNTATKQVQPTPSLSFQTLALDPCNDLAFLGEITNTILLYAVPIGTPQGTVSGFDPQSRSGAVGLVTYEPFTKTLIHYINDQTNPTFVGFQIAMPNAPTEILRGKTGALPWKVPTGIIPSIVATQNPDDPPCSAN